MAKESEMVLGEGRATSVVYSFALPQRESLLEEKYMNKMRNNLSFLPHKAVV